MSIWSDGEYEATAARLAPTAVVAVAVLAPGPRERVLDVGCGTGNGALEAARAGAAVTGVDPATRLLEVARTRAAEEGLAVELTEGDAVALPFADASFDAALSVFGVIFAEPEPAAAELVRRAEVLERVAAVLTETNEDPAAFRTTSEYDVVTVQRS